MSMVLLLCLLGTAVLVLPALILSMSRSDEPVENIPLKVFNFPTEPCPVVDVIEIEFELTDPLDDIGEPVLSLIELMKSNPKRFNLSYSREFDVIKSIAGCTYHNSNFMVSDKVSGEVWNITKTEHYGLSWELSLSWEGFPDFIKHKEREYLIEEVGSIYKERKSLYDKLVNLRKQRENNKERQRLMEIYCNEVEDAKEN